MKGLRLKAETTVGTETTRWVSDRSKQLIGPKRPVTDGWGVRIERESVRARNDLFVVRYARLERETEKKKKKKKKKEKKKKKKKKKNFGKPFYPGSRYRRLNL